MPFITRPGHFSTIDPPGVPTGGIAVALSINNEGEMEPISTRADRWSGSCSRRAASLISGFQMPCSQSRGPLTIAAKSRGSTLAAMERDAVPVTGL